MIIVSVFDGLGNQMFHYAFYKALKVQKKDVKIDIISSWNKYKIDHNGYELNNIFKLNVEFATAKERDILLNRVGDCIGKTDIISKIKRKILIKKSDWVKSVYFWKKPTEAISFNKFYFDFNNVYMYAHYQSEKYFKNIEKEIRQDFTFPDRLDEKNKILMEQIKNTNSVSVHVRRGDYIKNIGYGGICTLEYYNKALRFFELNIDNPIFYIFSNDIKWCKDNLNLQNAIFVNNNIGKNSYKDMQLMSCCKHNIIANSTFSWWGAWLNNNKDKIVLAPNRWFNSVEGTCDIIPESWEKIEIL